MTSMQATRKIPKTPVPNKAVTQKGGMLLGSLNFFEVGPPLELEILPNLDTYAEIIRLALVACQKETCTSCE